MKALKKLSQEGYIFDLSTQKIKIVGNPQSPSRDAIEVLEKNGYWIDLKERMVKDVAGIINTKKLECLRNNSIENKLAVLTHLKNKYETPALAAQYGYPMEVIKHAVDVLKEGKQKSEDTPKTYVCSDIHGMYGTYCSVIKKLKENDTLFILGDVIDRGSQGIKILQDIMSRPNVRLLMGNHEYMMIKCLNIIKKYSLNSSEITKFIEENKLKKWINYLEKIDMKTAKTPQEQKEIQSRIDAYKKSLNELGTLR